MLSELIYTRTALHQLLFILVTRYTVLQSYTTNPTLAANLRVLLLTPDDRDAVYCPTTEFFASTVYSKRDFAVALQQAEHVQARLRPQRGNPPTQWPSASPGRRRRRRRRRRRWSPRRPLRQRCQ